MDTKKYTVEHFEIHEYITQPTLAYGVGWRKMYRYRNLGSENEAKKWLKKLLKQNELEKLDRKLRIVRVSEDYTVIKTEQIIV